MSPEMRAIKTRERHQKRRAFSEQAMNAALDWHLEPGCSYHCISGGDVDSLTYLRGIVKQEPLDYCLISTWCMAMTDADEVADWIARGMVKRCDFYIGEIFEAHYADVYEKLRRIVEPTGGRVAVFRNHSKVMLAYGEQFDAAIASSANVNTNPRTEQATITVDTSVCDFYKAYYDDISAFNQDAQPEGWKPWARRSRRRARTPRRSSGSSTRRRPRRSPPTSPARRSMSSPGRGTRSATSAS